MGGGLATALYYFLFQSKPIEKNYAQFQNVADQHETVDIPQRSDDDE